MIAVIYFATSSAETIGFRLDKGLRDKGHLSHRFIMVHGKAEFNAGPNSYAGTIDGIHNAANHVLCRVGPPGQFHMF